LISCFILNQHLLLQENETKRMRAQKKAEEESKARRDKESQIEAERKALQNAKLQKAQIENQLARSMIRSVLSYQDMISSETLWIPIPRCCSAFR
jgi:multidrug resistance efflux pump